jgi:hypothetical protein
MYWWNTESAGKHYNRKSSSLFYQKRQLKTDLFLSSHSTPHSLLPTLNAEKNMRKKKKITKKKKIAKLKK